MDVGVAALVAVTAACGGAFDKDDGGGIGDGSAGGFDDGDGDDDYDEGDDRGPVGDDEASNADAGDGDPGAAEGGAGSFDASGVWRVAVACDDPCSGAFDYTRRLFMVQEGDRVEFTDDVGQKFAGTLDDDVLEYVRVPAGGSTIGTLTFVGPDAVEILSAYSFAHPGTGVECIGSCSGFGTRD